MVASIPGLKVEEECWSSSLNARLEAVAVSIHLEAMMTSIHLEAVAATSKSIRLRETLPTVSRMLDPYKNLVT
jgi:hypothetical protein